MIKTPLHGEPESDFTGDSEPFLETECPRAELTLQPPTLMHTINMLPQSKLTSLTLLLFLFIFGNIVSFHIVNGILYFVF